MNREQQRALDDLRQAVIDQKKVFLPPEPEDPSLAGLHQAVSAYDRLVSQLVIETLQGLDPQASSHDLRQVQAEIDKLFSSQVTQSHPRSGFYRSYAGRLARMLTLAETARG